MVSVWVSGEDLRTGRLPAVCALTGQPAEGTVPVRLAWLPRWTWILLLFGVLPFLVASYFAMRYVEGALPVVQAAVSTYHRRRRAARALAVTGVVLLAGSVALEVVPLAWVGGVCLVGSLAALAAALRGFVRARSDHGDARVLLSGVHPAFVEAVRDS